MPFEYPTNYSNNTVVEGVGDLFFGWVPHIIPEFAAGIIIMFWLATLSLNIYLGTKNGITVASFITFIIAVLFSWDGILNWLIPLALFIFVILGIFLKDTGESRI